jgi:hypothetical protein
VHVSATSQVPADGRQTVVLGAKTSTHVLAVPLQWSATSHDPALDTPVQAVVAEANASVGHTPEVPVHVSVTSHWPADARHVVPPALYTSTQVLSVPLQ